MDIAREPAAEKRGGKAGRVLGIIGTILLIGVVTGLIFVCIFAFYVKTCITPSLDLDLNDFTLNRALSITRIQTGIIKSSLPSRAAKTAFGSTATRYPSI